MKLRCIVWSATFALLVIAAMPLCAGEDVPEAAGQNGETQILQPVSEPPIKLVHVLNPGEREYLSPNLIGVQNIAMSYLPLTMNFINIIDAYREIVDGVRYEILLNAIDTKANDTDLICRLVIHEKPWLRTEWGGKVRELRHSNCTSDEENFADPMAKNRALNDKYESNALFNGGTRNELTSNEMDKLTAQIMPHSNGPKKHSSTTRRSSTSTTTTTSTESTVRAVITATPAPSADNDDEDDDVEVNTEELSDDEKKWLDDILSEGALNFEKSMQRDNKNDDDESPLIANDNTENPENFQTQDAALAEDQQRRELEMEQFEPIHVRSKRSYRKELVGGASRLEDDDAHPILQNSLAKLATGERGPKYTIGKIYSATKQVVSGIMTRIDADLYETETDQKYRCNISIWSQLWMPEGEELTIDCPGKKPLKKRLARSTENAEKKTHKKHAHHGYEKTEHLFNKFQVKFNKRYHSSMEHQMRMRIFKQNIKIIEELNRNEMGSAKYGITEFADMTSTEYKQRTGLWQRSEDKPSKHTMAEIPDIKLPKEFDWREKGVISEVKNQGSCGSCWAFSVTGNIEGLHAVKTGKLEEYSEQELLDCDTIDSACNGGLPDNAYQALEKIGGLELESEYPYEGRKNQCHFNRTLSHVQVKGAVDLPKNETAMAQWLLANGPISIGINANAMQFYRGGVSHPWRPLCSHSNLDHGVLIVGYGVSDYPMFKKTLPYWIVKNSWGKKWGEQGYYRVYRGDNTCGVSEMATSAILA